MADIDALKAVERMAFIDADCSPSLENLNRFRDAIIARRDQEHSAMIAHMLDHHAGWNQVPTCNWSTCPLVHAVEVVEATRPRSKHDRISEVLSMDERPVGTLEILRRLGQEESADAVAHLKATLWEMIEQGVVRWHEHGGVVLARRVQS